jgi:CRISPR-associated protein Cas1
MKRHLNTLFVLTPGTYLAKNGECLEARVDEAPRVRVPIAGLESVVCLGRVSASPQALAHCAGHGVALSYLTESGQFLARLEGAVSGNVMVRRTQYRWADDLARAAALARAFVTGKVYNARHVLRRGARETADDGARAALTAAADDLSGALRRLPRENDLDAIRGIEGEAGRIYWSAFPRLIISGDLAFAFAGRNRRPPLDPVNALLSFLYTLLVHDIRAALESGGVDPQVGFLHRDRPGRPGLALDMMEEFRAVLADRLALSLINRGQVGAGGFVRRESGAVEMDDATRRTVIAAWQERKGEEREHPFLKEKVSIGLFWHLQALLLKRYLRGDLDGYPPCLWR